MSDPTDRLHHQGGWHKACVVCFPKDPEWPCEAARYRDALRVLSTETDAWRSACRVECDCDACDAICLATDNAIDLLGEGS